MFFAVCWRKHYFVKLPWMNKKINFQDFCLLFSFKNGFQLIISGMESTPGIISWKAVLSGDSRLEKRLTRWMCQRKMRFIAGSEFELLDPRLDLMFNEKNLAIIIAAIWGVGIKTNKNLEKIVVDLVKWKWKLKNKHYRLWFLVFALILSNLQRFFFYQIFVRQNIFHDILLIHGFPAFNYSNQQIIIFLSPRLIIEIYSLS